MSNTNNTACQHCGKDIKIKQITLKSLFYDTINVIFNLEKGFLFTIKMLFINPGSVLNGYLKTTDRYRYYNPFRYAFILATASVFFFVYFDLYEKAITIGALNLEADNKEGVEFIEKYANFISLLIIPFLSLGSFLFFKSHNYAEHLVANFFVFGQTTLIGFVFLPLYLALPKLILQQQSISSLTLIIYGVLFYKSAFKQSWLKTIFKFLAAMIIGFVCVVLVGALIAMVISAVNS
ncbi:MAG: DUF3667 domain-containing protein [Bacteroidia bacterium]